MTDKQIEDVKKVIAEALSESIIGRVEQNIMNVLSPKVARMQTLQADAERATVEAKKQEGEAINKKKLLEDSFPALQQKLAQERTKFDAEMATMQKAKDSFQSQLNILVQQVKEAEISNGKRVREVQEKADKLMADIESNLAADNAEFERQKKAHEEFRKSIGL